jgi:hypothetical protein
MTHEVAIEHVLAVAMRDEVAARVFATRLVKDGARPDLDAAGTQMERGRRGGCATLLCAWSDRLAREQIEGVVRDGNLLRERRGDTRDAAAKRSAACMSRHWWREVTRW